MKIKDNQEAVASHLPREARRMLEEAKVERMEREIADIAEELGNIQHVQETIRHAAKELYPLCYRLRMQIQETSDEMQSRQSALENRLAVLRIAIVMANHEAGEDQRMHSATVERVLALAMEEYHVPG